MTLLDLLSQEAHDTLLALDLQDRPRAERLLVRLAERAGTPQEAVPLMECLLQSLAEAPDPEMALLNLERWASQLATPRGVFPLLREDPRLRDELVALFGSSQYLADILVRESWLYSLLLDRPGPRSADEYREIVASSLRTLRRPESRRGALRRVKRREFLRIGWRDLARGVPLEETVGEISDLADALIQSALLLAHEEVDPRFPTAAREVRFAVLAMGKLGARELNYSSDVDLVFVMDSPDPRDEGQRRYASKLAETLIAVLAEETEEGRCFRVDMRLRPEGRAGALVRSFAAFREYYDRWAETWERQALIKARPVAGDPELGERFAALIRPVVYRRLQGAALLEDVREMRSAVERKLEASGELAVHVKEGWGTIRDVEFAVQLLQLLFGSDHPELQVAGTLGALAALEGVGLLAADERRTLEAGYRFFRAVEHRLQLLHDLPVRTLPTEPRGLRRLARSMAFEDPPAFRAAFDQKAGEVRRLVEAIHRRLGVRYVEGGGLREALLSADSPGGAQQLAEELERRGFPEPQQAVEALVRLASGAPYTAHPAGTRRLFAELAPALLDACAAAADPTFALTGFADFADRKLLQRSLYQTHLEHPEATEAVCRVAGAAAAVMRLVLRYPELGDLITDAEVLAEIRSLDQIREALAERLSGANTYDRRLATLRRFRLREMVRMGARQVLCPVPPQLQAGEWSDLAQALVAEALATAVQRVREEGRWPHDGPLGFAVLALGRFGARDLHFASDLDLLYACDPGAGTPALAFEQLARALGDVLSTPTDEGRLFEVDLRLRPEGKQGFSVVSLDGARRYYGEGGRAQTWEFQALTRLRPVAGDGAVASRLWEILEPRVYRTPMPRAWTVEIREMKRRIEQERVGDRDRPWHLKLGPGGLSDIEFLVQYLQLRHGGEHPEVRKTGILEAVQALHAAGVLARRDAKLVERGYTRLSQLREALWLLSPDAADVLPLQEGRERLGRALARACGYGNPGTLERCFLAQTRPVRDLVERYLMECV
jgi:glutamate-ammonia-ligase adenylyltransferase